MNIGYIRVSTEQQHTDRQHEIIKKYECEKVYEEKITGTKRERPELNRMIEQLRKGDTIIIESLSRLSRSTKDLISLVEQFNGMGVDLISSKEQIDTTTATGRLVFAIFAALAQFERDTIAERTREGLKAARARGRKGGRPRADQKAVAQALKMYDTMDGNKGRFSISEISKACGISAPTLYRYINERKAKQK